MSPKSNPKLARKRRQARVRAKISGSPSRPRLNVFRSLNHIYAQIVDDSQGHTLVSASTLAPELKVLEKLPHSPKSEEAKQVGDLLAKRAVEKGITAVVFDRAGYKYHGRVKALAEAVREAGLKF